MNLVKLIANVNASDDVEPKNRVFYRCQKPEFCKFGLTDDGEIIVGLVLAPYCVIQHDFVAEDVSNVGAEASLIIPDGLEEGMILEAFVVNESTDWETGYIDDWDVELKPVTDPAELAEIEALRERLEREEEGEEEMFQLASDESEQPNG